MFNRIRIFALSALIAVGLTSFGGTTIAHTRKIDPDLAASRAMITPEYMAAVSQLSASESLMISRYKKCDLPSYAPELMAIRTATPANNWYIVGKCKMTYSGDNIPRFGLTKDQVEWMCGCDNAVVQYPQEFNSNEFVIKFFTSKPGYFSTAKPAHLKQKEVMDYYSHNQGAWVPFPDGSIRYGGPYQVFVVDSNHAVCAYGVWWTSGYVVGSNNFTVVPDRLLSQGVRCGEGSNVINPRRSN